MSKEVKTAPVVEYIIPKHIFSHAESGSDGKDGLLVELWDFGSR
jgi:U3 small nucleolar RNA-associated protein 19